MRFVLAAHVNTFFEDSSGCAGNDEARAQTENGEETDEEDYSPVVVIIVRAVLALAPMGVVSAVRLRHRSSLRDAALRVRR